MEILHLSDIHYGADYDGKFNTANQWATVVNAEIVVHPVILSDYEP